MRGIHSAAKARVLATQMAVRIEGLTQGLQIPDFIPKEAANRLVCRGEVLGVLVA